MGEKEEKGEEKQKKEDGEKKEGEGEKKKEGGGKKEEGPPEVVLKVDMHCEGCAKKIKRSVRRLEGVEGVKADTAANKLMVLGKVDPWHLKERVETRIRRNVDIISPANPPKKDASAGDAKKPAADDAKKSDDTKPKPPVVSTVVLKTRLHCEGCMQRIRRKILKMKGVEDVSFDALKELVIVKGTMDAKSLPAILKEKLKRSVDIVQPKKDDGGGGGEKKEKGGDGGGDEKKEKGGDGGGDEKKEKGGDGGGGEKKEKGGDGGEGEKKEKGDGGEKKDDGEKAAPLPAALVAAAPVSEFHRMDYYGPYGYRIEMMHAPQLFSDENPNAACSIM